MVSSAPLASKINTLSLLLSLYFDFKHNFSILDANTSQDDHLWFLQMDIWKSSVLMG